MGDEKLKSLGMVVQALRKLAERHGPSPQQILNYIHMQYNIPKERIKRRLGSILKRCREFGILKRTFGHQVPVLLEKPSCCDCTDCIGNCGFCGKQEKKKRKSRMCRSSKSGRSRRKSRSCKPKKRKMKRACKPKRKMRKPNRCRPKKCN